MKTKIEPFFHFGADEQPPFSRDDRPVYCDRSKNSVYVHAHNRHVPIPIRCHNEYTITYFFVTVRWQVKHEYRKERYAHARYDQIHRVEQRFSPHGDVERDV